MHKVAGIANVLTGDGDKAKGEWKLLQLSAFIWHRRLTLRASNTSLSSYFCQRTADATSSHIFFTNKSSLALVQFKVLAFIYHKAVLNILLYR